jgi:hypothetical protein
LLSSTEISTITPAVVVLTTGGCSCAVRITSQAAVRTPQHAANLMGTSMLTAARELKI